MATSIRLLSKAVLEDGRIAVQFSDNTSYVFLNQSDYDRYINLDGIDDAIGPIMKRVLLGWSHANQDAVNRQCEFNALETNRNVMRIRN